MTDTERTEAVDDFRAIISACDDGEWSTAMDIAEEAIRRLTTEPPKKFYHDTTESGDQYRATEEKWAEYRAAIDKGDYEHAQHLEEGNDPDFQYAPQGE